MVLVLFQGNPPVTGGFPHKGQERGDFMFSFMCAWLNDWAKSRDASDLRRHEAHYVVTVMCPDARPAETTLKYDALHIYLQYTSTSKPRQY